MSKITAAVSKIFAKEKDSLWLFVPVLIGFGAIFYFTFEENFCAHFVIFSALFFVATLLCFLDRYSSRFLVFIVCALFLAGSFYVYFYQKIFLNYTQVTGKIYVDFVGKVVAIQKFSNPVNGVDGANLLISQPQIYKANFVEKIKKPSKKTVKKRKTKKKKIKKNPACSFDMQDGDSRKAGRDSCRISLSRGDKGQEKSDAEKKPRKKKIKKKKQVSAKTIQKNFVNLLGYQEIDREFLDYSKNYQRVEWLKINDREHFPNPPPKISVNLIKNFSRIKVNDVVAMRAMLHPPKAKEFPDDFDFNFDAKFKKIGAYGFVIGEAKIVREAEISNADEWFIFLREKIRGKISNVINGDEAAIAQAFLIGDQGQISKEMLREIRNSGLAHLLSISGFHLSLASAICFVVLRFLLSRSEYLALNFDLKKISAVLAIAGTYFYLQLAGAPLPAQRAFVMVVLVFLALFVGEKINALRCVMFAALILILLNPYALFNISFQLSFVAILVLVSCRNVGNYFEDQPVLHYFWKIILISIAVQIATLPFLMRSFGSLALLGFVANILAIPLTSFVIMPLTFLALIAMPFALEKYFLLGLQEGVLLFERIAIFVAQLEPSNIASPAMSSIGVMVATAGLLLFLLLQSNLRLIGIAVFLLSFVTIFTAKKPDILFEKRQKFFAVKSAEGLVFSKNLKPSKQRQSWMNKMSEKEFKSLQTAPQKEISCNKNNCLISKEKKFLVLLRRNKISEICKNDFDVIVNLTAKYKLPECIASNKVKIDNRNFNFGGTQFFYFSGQQFTF